MNGASSMADLQRVYRQSEQHENSGNDGKDVEEVQKKISDKEKEKQRKKLLREVAKARRCGVCYLSRIPPHLKPLKLRHLLSQFAEVLRVYLAPEDPALRMRRKMAGKNTGKNFTEGWVEFSSKKDARKVAEMLNGESMGGKKRSAYYYDLWNMKYLKKFKWDNLTEEIAYRNAVREQKQIAEISAAKRERDFYLAKVDQSKAISAMEERKKKKQQVDLPATPELNESETLSANMTKIVRHFPQKKSVAIRENNGAVRLSQDILAVVMGKK